MLKYPSWKTLQTTYAERENSTITVIVSNRFGIKSKPQFDLAVQDKWFLSFQETAYLLGARRRTIQRLIAKGSLKVGKVGARSIIQRSEIDKLFN